MSLPDHNQPAPGQEWPQCPYRIDSLPPEALAQPLPSDALCAVQFGDAQDHDDPRRIVLPLRPLGPRADAGELWRSALPVHSGRVRDLGYAENGQVMMVQMHLPESAMQPMEQAVCDAYRQLIRFLAGAGYPQLLRVWNYLSDINLGEGDAERYRRFCVGRHRALADTDGFEYQLPAASAIGSRDDSGLRLYALAGRQPGLQVENPRQVSAFRYPRIYGERSPSFSRATWVPWDDGAQLLVSGTASIVGHATVHPGDTLAQLQQAAANLETVRDHAMRSHCPGVDPASLQMESCVLYVRDDADLPALLPLLPALFGTVPLRVLAGDICRRELLVEVEAMYRLSVGAAC